LSPGDKALCVEGGKFGERWAEICKAYNVTPIILKVEWGFSVTAEQVKAELAKDPSIKAVFITLVETSTGVTTDVESVAKYVKTTNAVLVVDAVSGLAVTDLQMDNWGVDVVCSGSHKGLMLPPGVAFVAVSPKAYKLVESSKNSRYYFDLRKAKKALDQTDTAFTPAIGIMIAMNESIRTIRDAGLQNQFAHYARLAKGVRAAAQALGLKLFAQPSAQSNVLTAICVPDGLSAKKIAKDMRDIHGITIAAGQGHIEDKVIRIAHMGCLDEYDLLAGIACLEKVLAKHGYKFEWGVGLSAAQKFYNSESCSPAGCGCKH
jgi:aspartate aminotransferase-like enzyme